METFKTPNGKEIVTFNEGFSIRIKFATGGELPEELSGKYTAFDHARTAIYKYLDRLTTKKNKE